jgi:hypothetical protein
MALNPKTNNVKRKLFSEFPWPIISQTGNNKMKLLTENGIAIQNAFFFFVR